MTPEYAPRPLLEVRDLVVAYRGSGLLRRRTEIRAVNGVSLDVPRGATVGIVGESGSGKSSLARAIVGLERPRSGQIRLDGQDLLRQQRSRRGSRRIQMIFQDSLNSLNPRRTVGSTLAEPVILHRLRRGPQVRDRVAELLEMVGLDAGLMDRRPLQLSGGQRQRVNIARALASEPDLIIADEPTSALDVSLRAQILNLLRRLQREHQLSYLFISHDLGVVRQVSSAVAVMYLGRFAEVADRDALYRAPVHPYTRALLAAAASTDPQRRRAARIPGEPPSPANPPSGCAFHPRCPSCTDRCRKEQVELIAIGPRHHVACPVCVDLPRPAERSA